MSDLLGKSTVRRRKAAMALRKNTPILDAECQELLAALKMEESSNNWQTQVEILKSIGLGQCVTAATYIYDKFIKTSDDYSLVSMVATVAYVRLVRKNKNDVAIVMQLIETRKYSLVEGALEVLGYDRMCPEIADQESIIKQCFLWGKERPKGYTDPRYGLAAACAGWGAQNVQLFLEECLQSNDAPLVYVAKNSLKKKYVVLR